MLVSHLLSLTLLYPKELTFASTIYRTLLSSPIEGLNIFNTLTISLVDIEDGSTPISTYKNYTKVAKPNLYYSDRYTLKD